MKYLFIFLLYIPYSANAQDMSDNTFYNSFMKYFKLSAPRERFMAGFSLHSIRMKTNSKGVIVSYEPSLNIDSILLKDIDMAFRQVDKAGLKTFKYRKKTLILPIMVIRGNPSGVDIGMWQYEKELRSNIVLLSPLIYLMSSMKPIVN
ncbi:hypothetical protein [Daejeonella rubra]|nr:hypothetical protein [Daejeonella rubra]